MNNLETAHIIEIILIIGIIIFQSNTAKLLWYKIRKLKDLNLHDTILVKVKYPISYILDFNYNTFLQLIEETVKKNVEDQEHEIEDEINKEDVPEITSMLLYPGNNIDDTEKIIRELNIYMLKNDQSMVNFNVIRDIVDRNYQVLDDDINQMLPTPLYLGLAATMLGIIFGLWGMITGDSEVTENVYSLLIGVGIAMTSSLIGLALTTGFSTFVYKNSKREAEEEKNEFYSMLQAHLLPELLRKGETGIEALNRRLERFGKVSADSVERLTSIAQTSANTLESQIKLMERVDELNVRKVSTTSLQIFEKLEHNLKSFEKFSAYWDKINNSIGATSSLVDNLRELSERFKSVDAISSKIQTTLSDYNTTMTFFTKHIEEIKAGGNNALRAVSNADVTFATAIDDLKKHMQERIVEINENGANLDVKLNEIGADVSKSLELATKEHLIKLSEAYNNYIPKFEKLHQLDNLPIISEVISEYRTIIQEQNYALVNSLKSNTERSEYAINELKEAIKGNYSSVNTHNELGRSKIEKIEPILRMIATGVIILAGSSFLVYFIFKLF